MSGKVQNLISCLKYNNRNVHYRHGLREIFWQRNSRRTLLKKQSVLWMPLEHKYCSFEDISRMETNAKSVVTSLDNATYQIKRNKRCPRPSFYTKRRRDNERIENRTRADYAQTPDGTTRTRSHGKALSVKHVLIYWWKYTDIKAKLNTPEHLHEALGPHRDCIDKIIQFSKTSNLCDLIQLDQNRIDTRS